MQQQRKYLPIHVAKVCVVDSWRFLFMSVFAFTVTINASDNLVKIISLVTIVLAARPRSASPNLPLQARHNEVCQPRIDNKKSVAD